jgi:hypothetical protein
MILQREYEVLVELGGLYDGVIGVEWRWEEVKVEQETGQVGDGETEWSARKRTR